MFIFQHSTALLVAPWKLNTLNNDVYFKKIFGMKWNEAILRVRFLHTINHHSRGTKVRCWKQVFLSTGNCWNWRHWIEFIYFLTENEALTKSNSTPRIQRSIESNVELYSICMFHVLAKINSKNNNTLYFMLLLF